MTDTKFNLATADKFELKKHAKEIYELSLPMTMGVETMRAKIFEHCRDNNLDMPESEAGEAKTGSIKKIAEKKITINIATAPGKNGSEPVFLGVNGVGTTVPRGINVDVSPAIVEVLRNAVQDIVTQEQDGELIHAPVPTYPFQIVAGTI